MNILALIPARMGSSRFPGKPMAKILGKPMIEHVYKNVTKCNLLTKTAVATCDKEIADFIESIGGQAVMTSDKHESGTDRCAEVVEKVSETYDVVINIQGDEPYIDPIQITQLCECFKDEKTDIATLIKKIESTEDLFNENKVKVVKSSADFAIYFSRNPIPFVKGEAKENWLKTNTYFKHIGIYGYRAEVLQNITQMPLSILEKAEGLEQLRWLENGLFIKVAETQLEAIAIDSPEDLKKIN